MRKLVTIQKIKKIIPHSNADRLEIAIIKGWQVVVEKGKFKENQLIIFFEIDSILPEKPEFEFLRKSCWNEKYKGFRLKTIKLRGQISQGLIMPLSILPYNEMIEFNALFMNNEKEKLINLDITNVLGVVKYVQEIPACLSGKAKASFPNFIPKTNEERIQNIPDILEKYKNFYVYVTEKLDGTSATFFYKDDKFGVCGRNWEWKKDDKNSYWKIAKELNIKEKLSNIGNFAIQGEIIGPGIQKNKYKLNKLSLYIFSIFDIDNCKYLSYTKMLNFCNENNFDFVPLLWCGKLNGNIIYWIEFSKGKSNLNLKVEREGIVVRTMKEISNNEFGKISFKSINPEFLLKNKE